jgi:hypothetical protein
MAGNFNHVRLSPVRRIPAPDYATPLMEPARMGSPDFGPTVSLGSTAGQSIVAAVKRKKIYCKAGAYQ